MKFATLLIVVGLIFIGAINWFNKDFASAFEADQSCHALLNNNYSQTQSIGCDHDLETRQWILYEKKSNIEPAKVLKRFKY